jgi:hypothetical protein
MPSIMLSLLVSFAQYHVISSFVSPGGAGAVVFGLLDEKCDHPDPINLRTNSASAPSKIRSHPDSGSMGSRMPPMHVDLFVVLPNIEVM